MFRNLFLGSVSILFLAAPLPILGISGAGCTVSVTGSVGIALTAQSGCSTNSVFLNPNINFVSGTPMPAGLIISKSSSSGGNANWRVAGTPSEAASGTGIYSFTDSNPGAVSMTINFDIFAAVVPVATFFQGTVGRPYPASSVTASGGSGSGYSYNLSSGSLPTGLTLASGGQITGTSSAAGTFNFAVQATDSVGNFGSSNFSIVVNTAVSTTASSTVQRTVGQAYSANYAATGGSAPVGYSISNGALPPGALLSPTTGVLSGTASAAATGSFEVSATDANGSTALRSVTHTISLLPTISLATPAGIVGGSYSQGIVFSGALTSASLGAGTLPPGLTLGSGGTVLSGSPTAAGTYVFNLVGTDSNGVAATSNFSIVIAAALGLSTASLPDASLGVAYSASVSTVGGLGAITLSLASGALPAGLGLAADGVVSGIPTQADVSAFTVLATDSVGNTATRQLSIEVSSLPIVISTGSLPAANTGGPYVGSIVASGGSGTLTFSLGAGSLPSGLTLASNGQIGGTPVATGIFNFTVIASDAFSQSVSKAFSISVVSPLRISTNPALPPATVGASVQVLFQTVGGRAPFTWSIIGAPAPGLIFSAGTLSGIPAEAGLSQFSITVSDSSGATAVAVVTQTVNPLLSILNNNLAGPFSRTGSIDLPLVGRGGTLPYSWSFVSGRLPFGVQFLPNPARLVGFLNGIGSYPITLRLSDAAGSSVHRVYTMVVGNGPQFQGNGMLPQATAASPYRSDFPLHSSLPIVEWQLGTGLASLPPGISFLDGELAGTPSRPGIYQFEVSAGDRNGSSSVQAFTLVVNPALELANVSTPQSFPRGKAALWKAPVQGGTAPFQYQLVSGSLPAGMQLNSTTGEISGSPAQIGDSGFTLEITDANRAIVRRFYSFRVVELFVLRVESLGSSRPLGSFFNALLEVEGGTPPYLLEVTAGGLPPGLVLSGLEVSGIPSQPGLSSFSITATDSTGLKATRLWSLTISSALEVFPSALDFRVIATSNNAVRQTVKVQSQPSGAAVQVRSTEPWLKVSSSVVRSPGFVEVWVDPLLLSPGVSSADLVFESGIVTRLPIRVERLEPLASVWSALPFPGPGGSWGVVVQAQAPRLPFSVRLDSIGLDQFGLTESSGEIQGPESFLLWLDRKPNASAQPRESSLAIQNLSTGEQIRVVIPQRPVPAIETSVAAVQLSAERGASVSSSVLVSLRSASPISATADQPWLTLDRMSGRLDPNPVFRISARISGLDSGLHSALVDLTGTTGRILARLPVNLRIGPDRQAVEVSEYSITLSRKNPARVVKLRNPSKDSVSYSVRSSSTVLHIASSDGVVPAGGEVDVQLSVADSALSSWARHSVMIALNHSDLRIVEVDLSIMPGGGRCPSNAPILGFLSPGAAFSARVGQAQLIRLAVRNACGEPLEGAGLSLLIPKEASLPLRTGIDGIWYGVWTPRFPANSLNVEAIWVDPANRQSVTRWLSGSVLPE